MAITELLFASLMPDTQREIAETVFERNQRREAEINDALKQEYARREAAIKNMYRLRALRDRDGMKKPKPVIQTVGKTAQHGERKRVIF